MSTATTPRYQLHRAGARLWYVQEVGTGELKALGFSTRKAAQKAVDEWNTPAERVAKLWVVR